MCWVASLAISGRLWILEAADSKFSNSSLPERGEIVDFLLLLLFVALLLRWYRLEMSDCSLRVNKKKRTEIKESKVLLFIAHQSKKATKIIR